MKRDEHVSTRDLILLVCIFILMGGFSVQAQTVEVSPEPTYPAVSIVANHQPIKKALENAPLEFKVTVNHPEAVARVILHFRDVGRIDYNSLPMGFNPASEMFEIELDERYHSDESMEYYIEIYPRHGNTIRIPGAQGSFYTIKTYRKAAFYMRPILLGLLILSPAIIAGIIGRIHRLHVKRTAEYQQRLRRRKRQLAREREKHYKQYLEKLTGVKSQGNQTNHAGKAKAPLNGSVGSPRFKKEPSLKTSVPAASRKKKTAAGSAEEEMVSTGELRRELDEILSREKTQNMRGTSDRPRRAVPEKPGKTKRPTGAGPMVSEKTKPGIRRFGSVSPSIPSESSTVSDQTQPVPSIEEVLSSPESPFVDSDTDRIKKPQAKPSGKDRPEKPAKGKGDKGGLEKSERDKLLDILGLDI